MSKEGLAEFGKINQGLRASANKIAAGNGPETLALDLRINRIGDTVGQMKAIPSANGIMEYDVEVFLNPEKNIKPITERPPQTINTWHAVISKWREIIPPEHRTPQAEFKRGLEEVEELREEINTLDSTPESAYRAGSEAVDIMIRMIGVVDALGLDTERLMEDKVDVIYRKYNPIQNGNLIQKGMSWEGAMARQKKTYGKS